MLLIIILAIAITYGLMVGEVSLEEGAKLKTTIFLLKGWGNFVKFLPAKISCYTLCNLIIIIILFICTTGNIGYNPLSWDQE